MQAQQNFAARSATEGYFFLTSFDNMNFFLIMNVSIRLFNVILILWIFQ